MAALQKAGSTDSPSRSDALLKSTHLYARTMNFSSDISMDDDDDNAAYVLMFPIKLPPSSKEADPTNWKAPKKAPLATARKIFKNRCERAADVFKNGLDETLKECFPDHVQETYTFNPGRIGISHDDKGLVKEVFENGQAHVNGVQKGDRIVKIGDADHSEAARNGTVRGALLAAEESNEPYNVTFLVRMTELKFQAQLRLLLGNLLVCSKLGFIVNKSLSVDQDELIVKLRLPTEKQSIEIARRSQIASSPDLVGDSAAIQQIAESLRYRKTISMDRYAELNMTNTDCDGYHIKAHFNYMKERPYVFDSFSPVDHIRLIRSRLHAFVDCVELMNAGVLHHEFPPHDIEKVTELENDIADLSRSWTTLLPKCELEEKVREYFGEELAFVFSWLILYTRLLVFPAAFGGTIRLLGLIVSQETKEYLDIGITVVVAVWASVFNEMFKRKTHRNVARWGMGGYNTNEVHRSDYDDTLQETFSVEKWKYISTVVAIMFVGIIVWGNALIHSLHRSMLEHPADTACSAFLLRFMDQQHVQKVTDKAAAGMVTLQIVALDAVYSQVAISLTNMQNHRTDQDWKASLVRKSVGVRLFNALFPFLYIAFAEIHVEGCPKGATAAVQPSMARLPAEVERACIDELLLRLRENMVFYFIFDTLFEICMQFKNKFMIRREIKHEMAKEHAGGQMTYLQVQAKMDYYGDEAHLEDFMGMATQFALITFFSAISPELAFVALVANLVKIPLLSYRHLLMLKRVYPRGADGIGVWQNVFELIGFCAVLVNSGLAFLVLPGLREHMTTVQQVIAVFAAERLLIIVKAGVDVAIDDIPADILKATEFNEQNLSELLGVDVEAGKIDVPAAFLGAAVDIGPAQEDAQWTRETNPIAHGSRGSLDVIVQGEAVGSSRTLSLGSRGRGR